MAQDNLRLMVQLYFLIKDGHYPSNKTIQEKFNVSSRTAYRYIHILKNRFHAPIAYDLDQKGYYSTEPDWDFVRELQHSE
ncbi:MAG TPA: HTH domain-containing protein [Methylomirabilota bacterium]|nr:HTH domain-containing protein [Methylomirabilota bacterium]